MRNFFKKLLGRIPASNTWKWLVNAWYARIFYGAKKKGTLYLGRITKRFLKEKDGPVDFFEVNFLKPLWAPSNTVLEESPIHLSPDLGLFNSYDITAVPLQSVTYVEGRKWRCMNYPLLYNYYKLVEKLERKVLSRNNFENIIEYYIIYVIYGGFLQNWYFEFHFLDTWILES